MEGGILMRRSLWVAVLLSGNIRYYTVFVAETTANLCCLSTPPHGILLFLLRCHGLLPSLARRTPEDHVAAPDLWASVARRALEAGESDSRAARLGSPHSEGSLLEVLSLRL